MSDAAESSIWWELDGEEEGDGVEQEETRLQNTRWKCDRGKDVGRGNKPGPQPAANKSRRRHGTVLRI